MSRPGRSSHVRQSAPAHNGDVLGSLLLYMAVYPAAINPSAMPWWSKQIRRNMIASAARSGGLGSRASGATRVQSPPDSRGRNQLVPDAGMRLLKGMEPAPDQEPDNPKYHQEDESKEDSMPTSMFISMVRA